MFAEEPKGHEPTRRDVSSVSEAHPDVGPAWKIKKIVPKPPSRPTALCDAEVRGEREDAPSLAKPSQS